jgi:hypothetical protein
MANAAWSADMRIIHRLARWWQALTRPGTGAHRAGQSIPPPAVAAPRPAPSLCRPPRPRSPYGLEKPLDGDAQRIVRPYVEREQWQRRRVLYYATFGIDLDTRMIHVEGAAR